MLRDARGVARDTRELRALFARSACVHEVQRGTHARRAPVGDRHGFSFARGTLRLTGLCVVLVPRARRTHTCARAAVRTRGTNAGTRARVESFRVPDAARRTGFARDGRLRVGKGSLSTHSTLSRNITKRAHGTRFALCNLGQTGALARTTRRARIAQSKGWVTLRTGKPTHRTQLTRHAFLCIQLIC